MQRRASSFLPIHVNSYSKSHKKHISSWIRPWPLSPNTKHTVCTRTHTHTNSSQSTLPRFIFSYRLCGKGWSPPFAPLTRAGPAPSGQWPVAWCQVRTRSYTCTASAWSQPASSRTCGRNHRCRRWWHSSPPWRWLWRTSDLRMGMRKGLLFITSSQIMGIKRGCWIEFIHIGQKTLLSATNMSTIWVIVLIKNFNDW